MIQGWLPMLSALVVALVLVSTLERQIKQLVRVRWPDFDYDSQSVLTWGIAGLGLLTMMLFLVARP